MTNFKKGLFKVTGLGGRMVAVFFALAVAFGVTALTACGNPAGPTAPPAGPTVNVTVLPSDRDVIPGLRLPLLASVAGGSEDDIAWSIRYSGHDATVVAPQNGRFYLMVSEHEPTDFNFILVRATHSSGVFGEASFNVIDADFTIEDILITPVSGYEATNNSYTTIYRAGTAVFKAQVITNPPEAAANFGTVVWYISAGQRVGNDHQTEIERNEVLVQVSSEHNLEDRNLTLRARALAIWSEYREVTISIPAPVVTGVTISHDSPSLDEDPYGIDRGGVVQFYVDVQGNHNPILDVSWHIKDYYDNATNISSAGLLSLGASEPEGTITVWAVSNTGNVRSNEITVNVLQPHPYVVYSIDIVALTPSGASPLYVHRGTTINFRVDTEFEDNREPLFSLQRFIWTVQNGHVDTAFDTYTQPPPPPPAAVTNMLRISEHEAPGNTFTVRVQFYIRGATDETDATFQVTILDPVAETVSVTAPDGSNASRGGNIPLNAVVAGLGHPSQSVDWDFPAPPDDSRYVLRHAETRVTGNANPFMLQIAADQLPGYIRVRATSTVAPNPQGYIAIHVRHPLAQAVEITASEDPIVRGRGMSYDFGAATTLVTGPYGNPYQGGITWSIVGHPQGTTGGSSITPAGYLTVGYYETITPLTIRASSAAGGEINASIGHGDVNLYIPVANAVAITPTSATVARGQSQEFSAIVTGNNNPQQGVTWSIVGHPSGTPDGSSITPEGLLTIADYEYLNTLSVQATASGSQNINNGWDTVIVSIPSRPTGIILTGAFGSDVPINRAGARTRQFGATVTSTFGGTLSQDVEWQIAGAVGVQGGRIETYITGTGLLTVSGREPVGTTRIQVMAWPAGFPELVQYGWVYLTGELQVGRWEIVRAGTDHAVAITRSGYGAQRGGALYAWGRNQHGQLGLGSTGDHSSPQRMSPYYDWEYVSAGWAHTVALREGWIYGVGRIWSSGHGSGLGVVGLGNNNRLSPIDSRSNWATVQATHSAIFAINEAGELWAMGGNAHRLLGVGNTANQTEMTRVYLRNEQDAPLPDEDQPVWVSIRASLYSALAMTSDGKVFAWGSNAQGQLSNEVAGTGNQTSPQQILNTGGLEAHTWETIAVGMQWAAAINSDGHLYTWGNNTDNRAGRGTTVTGNHPIPARIGGSTTFSSITLNNSRSGLAIDTDGQLWSWGFNLHGQVGRGTSGTGSFYGMYVIEQGIDALGETVSFPLSDPNPPGADVPRTWLTSSMTQAFALAIDSDGTMWSWGLNANGALGLGHTNAGNFRPVEVPNGE